MPVSLKVTGLDKVIKRFDGMRKRAVKSQPFWGPASLLAFKKVISHFEQEKGPKGRWKELSPVTIARRRGQSSKPLQDTGRLKGSILNKAFNNKAIVFTNVKYAIFHDKGTKKIPQRKFMWIEDGFVKTLADKYGEFVVDGKR